MKVMLAVGALALGAIGVFAQPTPTSDARRLLESPSLRDKAWGAWYAGASHDPLLREMLVAKLRLAQSLRWSARDSEAYAYVQALFDALIQIPGAIPNDAILPFEGSWRPEILILMGRDPAAQGNERALLGMRGLSLPDPEWVVVNDLLFAGGSKVFFQKALEEIRLTHDFVVEDQPVAWCGGSIGCGLTVRRFPKGFPPIALYQFWASMTQPGDILFLEQPIPTYYRRMVVPTGGEVQWSDCKAYLTNGEPRQGYLARFLGSTKSLSVTQSYELFHPRTNVDWHGSAQAAIEMEKLLDEQTASLRSLIGDAQKRGVLLDASGMHFTIRTTVLDSRRDRSEPLPAVASREVIIP
jgi:hypothetical protein